MLSNKKNISSSSKFLFQSRSAGLLALLSNAQRATKKLTELNVAAANALATESREVAQQYLCVDSPQAMLAFTLRQAQANVAKANSYARHLRSIMSGNGSDELVEMKIAIQKSSLLTESPVKKLPAAAIAALTLSSSSNPVDVLAPLSGPAVALGRASSGLMLAKSDVTDVTDVTEVIDVTDVTDVTDLSDMIEVPDVGAAGTVTPPSDAIARDR